MPEICGNIRQIPTPSGWRVLELAGGRLAGLTRPRAWAAIPAPRA